MHDNNKTKHESTVPIPGFNNLAPNFDLKCRSAGEPRGAAKGGIMDYFANSSTVATVSPCQGARYCIKS